MSHPEPLTISRKFFRHNKAVIEDSGLQDRKHAFLNDFDLRDEFGALTFVKVEDGPLNEASEAEACRRRRAMKQP